MPFKLHLIIISILIVFVYMAWGAIHRNSLENSMAQPQKPESLVKINIAHANWGMNCNNRPGAVTIPIPDNNVKDAVAKLCDGQTQCTVPINSSTLGADPAPMCVDKILKIEYRCFSYDRLKDIKGISGSLTIICDPAEYFPEGSS